MGSRLRRNARSHMRATSRWLVKRTLPNLEKRSRRRRWSSGSTADQPDRDAPAVAQVLARALAAARRWPGRGHHVLDPETGTGAAVVAGRPAAVLDAGADQRVLPVAPQEVAMQPGRN